MCSKGKCLLKCCGGIKEVPSTNTVRVTAKVERAQAPSRKVQQSRASAPNTVKEATRARASATPRSREVVSAPSLSTLMEPNQEMKMSDTDSTHDIRDASTSIDKHFLKLSRRTLKRSANTPEREVANDEEEPTNSHSVAAVETTSPRSNGDTKPSEKRKAKKKFQDANLTEYEDSSKTSPHDEHYNKPKKKKRQSKRGVPEAKYGYLLPVIRTPAKLLLVYNQPDIVTDTQTKAGEKLGFEVTQCTSYDTALEEFQSKSHDLVIIDTRSAKALDYNTLCRSIRNTRGNQHSVLVAIVKKSVFEKDESVVMTLLESGFNRCIVENVHLTTAVNEMVQIKHSDMQPMAQHATCQAVYAGLDKCKDVVLITDESLKIQYANRSCEKAGLGTRPEELVGKTLQEQLAYDTLPINTMANVVQKGREWNGNLILKKKTQEPLHVTCRAIPISCAGRSPTHFVLILDTSHAVEAVLSQSRGSVHSIRRGSNDVRSVGSDFYRRTSLAKLNALPLEAPITKIISLIDQARENSSPNTQVVQLLDKVEDILRTPELYNPQVKEDRHEEPIVSELITALLSKQSQPSLTVSSRRSSNDSSMYRPSKGGVIKVPAALRELLDTSLSWEFDIFRLEDLTKKRPLQYLGMNLFTHFEVAAVLNCDEKTLYNWLIIIEANYHADNTYHNSTHAADVMQAIAGFLEKEKLKSIMDSLDEATSLIAAAAHDVDHPGKSNAFLANSDNPLAILYNDITILESHHSALMFKLTLGDERVNIFKHLDKEAYKIARHNVIDMILATEMTKHFEHLAKFVNVFCTKPSSTTELDVEPQDFPSLTVPENITLIKRMMIKCSDVSNPTRPLRLCIEWARRIAEEYFQQTDEEKERGLPVVMPMFDRHTCSIPKSQIGFVDYIINDMFEAWNAFIDMPELITYMRQNYIKWKEFDEQGLSTLADIKKLQNSVLMCPMFPLKSMKTD